MTPGVSAELTDERNNTESNREDLGPESSQLPPDRWLLNRLRCNTSNGLEPVRGVNDLPDGCGLDHHGTESKIPTFNPVMSETLSFV